MDIEDLKAAIESGSSSEESAQFFAAPTASTTSRANARSWGLTLKGPIMTTKRTDQQICVDAVREARRILSDYVDPGGAHLRWTRSLDIAPSTETRNLSLLR